MVFYSFTHVFILGAVHFVLGLFLTPWCIFARSHKEFFKKILSSNEFFSNGHLFSSDSTGSLPAAR